MPEFHPHTPQEKVDAFRELVQGLNADFCIEIPLPHGQSPITLQQKHGLRFRGFTLLRMLHYQRQKSPDGKLVLDRVLNNFDEWIHGRQAVANQIHVGRANGKRGRQRSEEPLDLNDDEKEERLRYLVQLLEDEKYLAEHSCGQDGSFNRSFGASVSEHPLDNGPRISPKRRRVSDDEDDEFHTAPNSPVKNKGVGQSPMLDLDKLDISLVANDVPQSLFAEPQKPTMSFTDRLRESKMDPSRMDSSHVNTSFDGRPGANANNSFSTVSSASLALSQSRMQTSFQTDITEMTELQTQSTYADSIVDGMLEESMSTMMLPGKSIANVECPPEATSRVQEDLISQLVDEGPFSINHPFSANISLRYRYEIERIGRAWNVSLDKMLRGDRVSFPTQDGFWSWINKHSQRKNNPLPEKSSERAWDAAAGDFKTDRPSEVVVLTGELDWCQEGERGLLKLKLNPLKPERTCRFHRRFGSDRFLTPTIPAPSRPPAHWRFEREPSVIRETIAAWLTRNDHQCLGRTWRPFYVEEVKNKKKTKADPRFRIEFFAVDGVDFDHPSKILSPSPPNQASDAHTPMSLDALLEWHMPSAANSKQSNCKLFQRLSLGLSKTFASVPVRSTQILRLRDPEGQPVMNDGCALMSRSLANKISHKLGIDGTPSCFQGRIAGAKGLWMVDRAQSCIESFRGGDDIWIQISDSQLKIHPHPHPTESGNESETVDVEKLTFEVVSWSKELHPVDLNIQLLAILEHGGRINSRLKHGGHANSPLTQRVAELTRKGIAAIYEDFEKVLQADSSVLCRGLMQKLRPAGDAGSKSRTLHEWVSNDGEFIIRLSEAGFPPLSFYPLRKKLQKYLNTLLDRHVEELKISVPLSTYAYCIADPYGILEPHEVHFSFSRKWKDSEGTFEDDMLEDMDVLVGRLPAHVPSDIQKRRAVWKQELRHFVDVIVFSTKGHMPLAHMLSGGDYDGDTPWICWDPELVDAFSNSPLPEKEFPPEHYGLTKHSKPMAEVPSIDDFLQSTFEFNLTQSNLGRCAVEHEKIAYDESINSTTALELAHLLCHLVDGRKGGVHLSEQAWQQYRKQISPRGRTLPAYRNPERKANKRNIADYLKFWVAASESERVRKTLEQTFPQAEHWDDIDEDLARPWKQAKQAAATATTDELNKTLLKAEASIEKICKQWSRPVSDESEIYSVRIREAVEAASAIFPPAEGSHPLIHTWQNNLSQWRSLLASYTYSINPRSTLVFHIFGEELCELKTATMPSRSITHEVVAIYRVNQKMVSHLSASELPGDIIEEDGEIYDGEDAIEALLDTKYYARLEDGTFVE